MFKKIVLLWLGFLCFGTGRAQEEKRMALVMPSYNNAEWYKKNLDSVFEQNYDNWYILYVDDCSPDGTADLVKAYVAEKQMEHKVTVIANTERKGALANHFIATHMCDDWDIVVQLDGDDWFPNNDVLSFINAIYDDPNIWLTYGSFEDWPGDKRGYCKPTPEKTVKEKLYRETYWAPGQLRTFYAWVFKKIKAEDLLWNHQDASLGKFYPASCDLAFSYPMMEMVGPHFKYIDDIIYIHNIQTPINDFKVNRVPQVIASNVLMYKKKYEQATPPPKKQKEYKNVDVVIISYNGLEPDSDTLRSLQEQVTGIHEILVVDVLGKRVSLYNGNKVDSREYNGVRELLVKELFNWWKPGISDYVLILHNGMEVVDKLDLIELSQQLQATQAYALFPSLGVSGKEKDPYVPLHDDVCIFRGCYASPSWLQGSQKLCVFSHKQMIRERIAYLNEDLVVEKLLPDLYADGMLFIKDPTIARAGLCFKKAKIVEKALPSFDWLWFLRKRGKMISS